MDPGHKIWPGSLSVFCTLLAFVSVTQIISWWIKTASRPPYPPGPKPKPVIGNLLDFPTIDYGMHYLQWGRKYNSSVLHASMLGNHVVILNTLEDAEELLERRASNYSDRIDMPMVKLMGYGTNMAFMPHGPLWRHHRKLAQQNFRLDTIASHQPVQKRRVHLMLKGLLDDPESLFVHNRVLSMSIPLEVMYGYDVTSLDDNYIVQAEEVVALSGTYFTPPSTLINFFPILGRIPAWIPGAATQKIAAEARRINRKLETEPMELVKQAVSEGVANPCVLSEFLEKRRGTLGYEEDEEAINQLAVTIYSGASDTIIAALASLFYVLATRPDIQRNGQEEIDKVVGSDRLPDFEDRASLPYVDALYRELLRYYPPTPLAIPHCVRENDYYKGYLIPKGAVVSANVWAMTRDESLYPNAHEFKPERFIDENGRLNNDARVLAYGFGRRICIGKHSASSILWLTIASLLACFDIGKAKDTFGNEIEILDDFENNGITNHKKPFKCSITPRSQSVRPLVEEAVVAEKLLRHDN